jgi:predicted nucleic acid-binding Zn ribbon protein
MSATITTEPRHCIKCGREIGDDETICAVCNRAGMATPSASQYHGTVAVAIVLAVVALAVAASLSMRGVGPYGASVEDVAPAERAGYVITYAVTNEGTRPGRAKCQLVALGAAGERLRTRTTVTRPIEGGTTATLTETIPGLEAAPAEVRVSCS